MTTTHKFFWIISSIILSACSSSNQENVQENIQENENMNDTTVQKTEEYSDSEYDFNESYFLEYFWQNSPECISDESILRKLKENDPYSPEGVRFDVENDTIANNFYREQNVKDFFEYITLKEVLYMPEEHKNMRIAPTIGPNLPNGLLETVRNAYDGHYPLALSPDVIWLTICQGMSKHINLNFKSLENKIYKNGHPNSIRVRNDSVAFASQWSVAIDSLAQQTRRYTDPYFYEAFVPQFSTTTPIDHVAYQITLLDAQKKAFSYIIESGCGFPWIVLRGTTEDWELIKNKLSILDTLEMTEWKESLLPILDEFIEASQGRANKTFWMNIFKTEGEYETYAVTGWILKLFPYIDSDNKPNPYLNKRVAASDNLTTDRFPSSILSVPFVWINFYEGRTDSLYFWSGILGAKQYGDKTLEPFISWALTTKDYKKEFVEKYMEMRRSWENNK